MVVALPASGCALRVPATASYTPRALYVRELCPDLEYEVVGKVDESFVGWGLFGFPLSEPKEFGDVLAQRMGELGGDALMDVKIEGGSTLLYLLLYGDSWANYSMTATVVRYTNDQCGPGPRPFVRDAAGEGEA